MKERGMIFNDEMVRALLSGKKKQTRRVISDRHIHLFDVASNVGECYSLESGAEHANSQSYYREFCPFGSVGDRIWVRETWARYNIDQYTHDMAYRATPPEDWPDGGRWRPSIHMPRWASRITLEITDVRVEQLNAISENDAQSEGVGKLREGFWQHYQPGWTQHQLSARGSFATLWKSIYGEESWNSNPWIWVIEFRRFEGEASK